MKLDEVMIEVKKFMENNKATTKFTTKGIQTDVGMNLICAVSTFVVAVATLKAYTS